MARGMRKIWLAIPYVAVLVTCSFLGCERQDLNKYHPAREHSSNPVDASTPTTSETDGEPTANSAANGESAISSASTTERPANDFEVIPVSALVPVNVVDGNKVKALMSVSSSDQKVASASVNSDPPASRLIADASPATEPLKVEVLIKDKKFSTDKTGALRVSFDDLDLLKVLNMEPVVVNAKELMPAWLQGLDGKTIRIRGFMYPTYDTEGIEHFVLARDNQICCFGRDPKIYDLVQVDMKPGKTTSYIPATRAFDVVGKFKIEMLSDGGKPYGLYVIEQAEVIDR